MALVVAAFLKGTMAEEVAHRYPTLPLADVYSVIGYYLRRQCEVEAYLHERDGEAARLREEIEARFDPTGMRARLLSRREPPRPYSGNHKDRSRISYPG
jgi:hypothetical protein